MKKLLLLLSFLLFCQIANAQFSPVTVYEVNPVNVKFLKPKNIALGSDSLYLTVYEMFLNLPKQPQKYIFDFPESGVAWVYLVSDEPLNSINRYRNGTQLYTEIAEPNNGRYMLTVCTQQPITMLKDKMRVLIDGKPTFIGKVNQSTSIVPTH